MTKNHQHLLKIQVGGDTALEVLWAVGRLLAKEADNVQPDSQ